MKSGSTFGLDMTKAGSSRAPLLHQTIRQDVVDAVCIMCDVEIPDGENRSEEWRKGWRAALDSMRFYIEGWVESANQNRMKGER